MEDALYGANGFYTSQGFAGRRGDFITSPEVGPLFGAVVARFLDEEWRRAGQPAKFNLFEVGAGPGTLARTVFAAQPACMPALRYVAVERSDTQRLRHPDGVESLASRPEGELRGVVFANELLDNLPFRLAVFDGGWRESYVVDRQEVLSTAFDPCPAQLPERPTHGARAPLVGSATAWVDDVLGRLHGVLVAIDYFAPTTASLAARPWREWLRTYRGHERGGHYLADPGTQDITCEVPIDQLPEPHAVRSQAQWLGLNGIDELVDEGRAYWVEHASRPDTTALRMRSRVAEREALVDGAGLGSFLVLEWRR